VHEAFPLEVVSDQIADCIICKRKIDLANKIKNDMLEQAENNNDCTVYEL